VLTNNTVLRVMEPDNSCLFTAFGGALQANPPVTPTQLRRMIAVHIMNHPEKFTNAILDNDPEEYCADLQSDSFWGGHPELSALSDMFDLHIHCIDTRVCLSRS
jgi:ubiquitin thioesterase OTU1